MIPITNTYIKGIMYQANPVKIFNDNNNRVTAIK